MYRSPHPTLADAVANTWRHWPDQGFVFQDVEGVETARSFREIEQRTARRAAALQRHGLRKGDRLGLVVIEPEDFVLTFFAAVRIGVIPVPLYPPLSMGGLDAYAARTARILDVAGASLVAASSQLQNVLWGVVGMVKSLRKLVCVEDLEAEQATPDYPAIDPGDICFLQYTSGSTNDPKGVIVTHETLRANTDSILGPGLDMNPATDRGCTWLPLYHDMGLIGFVIGPMLWGISVTFVPTIRFLRRPNVWMDAVHRHRATVTFAPPFAFALAAKKARSSDLEGWDLSCIKALGCGAEPIPPAAIRHFVEVFAKAKLRKEAVMPAYGMAEATLAVALKPLPDVWNTRTVDAARFEQEGIAVPPAAEQGQTLEHVGHGAPFPGHEVEIVGEDGKRLPDGREGEIRVRGPSVTPGYFNNAQETAAVFRDGWLYTGDLGYQLDGQLYITGRIKDLIILHGRNIHPQSIEWEASQVAGVRKGSVVAFSVGGASSEQVVVVAEARGEDHAGTAEAIREAVRDGAGVTVDHVLCLRPGVLPKTSSGKLQRRRTRALYTSGELGRSGSRTPGSVDRWMLARHVLRSFWARARATMLRR